MELGINNDIENSSLASNIHLKNALPHVVYIYISKVVWFYIIYGVSFCWFCRNN